MGEDVGMRSRKDGESQHQGPEDASRHGESVKAFEDSLDDLRNVRLRILLEMWRPFL